MKKISWIAAFVIFILLKISVSNNKTLSDQQIHRMIDEGSSDNSNIIFHKEKVTNGLVVFYGNFKNTNSLEARFLKKRLFGWAATFDRGGGGFGSSIENIHSIYLPKMDKKSPFPMLLGMITDSKIAEIEVEYIYGGDVKKVKAKTILGKDRYIWFAFVDEAKKETTYKIKGFSSNGDLIETTEDYSVHLPTN
ncbi:hypothetical protein ACFSO7_16165 [Bacillus sp. CGMCC 1.16607]|uniref:hypothetical protein n=1 Tax=Bacillus sp. CGMCC 1.16607 TaxID=3351842 RepID=UPI00364511CC